MNTGSVSIHAAPKAFPPGLMLGRLPIGARKSPGARSGGRNALIAHAGRVPARTSYFPPIRVATKAKIYEVLQAATPDQLVQDWLRYLARECVDAMVVRNWHHTTR
jgi:hypothetical protein